MAGSTGWGLKIFTNSPGDIVPVPFMLFRIKNIPVLAFFVNFKCRGVRFEVALGTRIRFSGYLDGKTMSRMTCGTRPGTAIRINPSYPLIGPVGKVGDIDLSQIGRHLFHASYRDLGTMAAITTFSL